MNAQNHVAAARDGLWSFSLAFYERPGVAPALLALQDGPGLNVALILFAIWLGLSGRGRLDAPRVEAAEREIRTLHVEVVQPLRALRRHLKIISDDDVQRLRDSVKAVEIEAERVALSRLAGVADPVSCADPVLCLADAEANLCLVVGSKRGSARPRAIIRRELRRFARQGSSVVPPAPPPHPTV